MYDEMWPGGPRFIKTDKAFAIGTDAVLLSDFARAGAFSRVIDLGCGSGVIPIMLAWDRPKVSITGVEIVDSAAVAARGNAAANLMSERMEVINSDLRDHRTLGGAGEYDLCVCNPPYFPSGSGKVSDGEVALNARSEQSCTLKDVCSAASYYVRWGGRFCIVHRPERLSELLCAMSDNGLEPKRLRLVQNMSNSAPSLVLVEGKRGAKPGLKIEPPLILRDADGRDSAEILRIYHRNGE